jgi:hypothetical protein
MKQPSSLQNVDSKNTKLTRSQFLSLMGAFLFGTVTELKELVKVKT